MRRGVSLFGVVSVLAALATLADVVKGNFLDHFVRNKREWIIPPTKLMENTDYTQKDYIAKIRSDNQANIGDVRYSLHGAGADKNPFGLFYVDAESGFVKISRALDRELIHQYNVRVPAWLTPASQRSHGHLVRLVAPFNVIDNVTLSGLATYPNGTHAENNIELRVVVLDKNDNPPIFPETQEGSVYELSEPGSFVMKIQATDADEPNNINSQIAYDIIEQNPPGDMFYIDPQGNILVKQSNLDRELHDSYTLKVRGRDLNGAAGGNEGTGTVVVKVKDVNDNLPTLTKDQYSGSVKENTQGVEVMRIKAEDLDVERTENWDAVFDIVSGNEAGYFSITTDPVTNEGILMLDKAVNYEDMNALDLGLTVRNKANLFIAGGGSGGGAGGGGAGGGGAGGGGTGGAGGGAGGSFGTGSITGTSSGKLKSYPIKISVENVPEGPSFDPKVKAIPISEGTTFDTNSVLTRYPAIDGDTGKVAENVRYLKGYDPDNWLSIDPVTSEIKMNKKPDRESPHLVNGTYYARVLCISEDIPSATATGTIAIQVEDFNDNCPKLTSNVESMCTTGNSVTVTAVDEDAFPNSAPFDFYIRQEETEGKWGVEHLNETSAILRCQEPLWPGSYVVTVEAHDQQGHACPEPQKVKVQVCTCADGISCGPLGSTGGQTSGSELGPAGIGLLFLGLLMLLLIPLLLMFCHCGGPGALPGGFAEMPFDTKPNLMTYHTEGQGENTEVPLLTMPSLVDIEKSKTVGQLPSTGNIGGGHFQDMVGTYESGMWGRSQDMNGYHSEFDGRETTTVAVDNFSGFALSESFLGSYYTQKASFAPESLGVKDSLLMYHYEGQGSPVGSVGCCSLLEADNDLQFLDNLGPKFKTLAEVCGGKVVVPEVKPVPRAPLNVRPAPRTAESSTTVRSTVVTQQQPPPQPQPQPQPQPPPQPTPAPAITQNTERHVVNASTRTSVKEGGASVRAGMAGQGQTILMQQPPVYYTTAPVMQPMHYIMQPQMQNTMYLANSPAPANMQGMVVVQGQSMGAGGGGVIHSGGIPQGMMVVEGQVPQGQTYLVQGGTLKSGGTRVLVGGQGGAPMAQGIHLEGGGGSMRTGSLSQGMMVVEGHGGAGQMLQGQGPTYLVQGGPRQGGLSTVSQSTVVVEGQNIGEGGLGGMASSAQMGSMRLPGRTEQSGSRTVTTSTTRESLIPVKSVVHKKKVVTTEKVTR